MDIYIDNINTFEKRNKLNTIKCRPIYEVLDKAYFIDSNIFSYAFMQKCNDSSNEAQFIPIETKNNIKQMATEQ